MNNWHASWQARHRLHRTCNGLLILLGVTLFASVLVGCADLSGVGGNSRYGCQAPAGIACESVSNVYQQRTQRSRTTPAPARKENDRPITTDPSNANPVAPAEISFLRTQSRLLRLWVKPWIDSEGDLVDQSYLYVQLDTGQWQIDQIEALTRAPRIQPSVMAPATPIPATINPTHPSVEVR